MVVYMVSAEVEDTVPGSQKVCSWHPTATDALNVAKVMAATGNRTHVNRIRVRVSNKKAVCELLSGRITYDTWDLLFTCYLDGDEVRTHRSRLA